MLYPLSYPVEQTTGIEPATSGKKAGALPLSYVRVPTTGQAPYTGLAVPPARAETEAPAVALNPADDREAGNIRPSKPMQQA